MKKTFTLPIIITVTFLCSLLNTSFGALPETISPWIINSDNCHSYILLNTSSWTEAEEAAVKLGGHLVTVNDDAEEKFIWDTFKSYGGKERSLWIGLNDAKSEGVFVWSSGEPFGAYNNWGAGEPNNFCSPENYVNIFPPSESSTRAGFWNDITNSGYDKCSTPGGWPTYGIVEIACPAATILTPSMAVICSLTSPMSIPVIANEGPCIVSYQWKKDGIDISGAISRKYSVTTTGYYSVTEAYKDCSNTSAATYFSLTFEPRAYITAPDGLNLCATKTVKLKANSGAGFFYQWYKNGRALTGRNKIDITVINPGVYKVKITNYDGCSKVSATVKVNKRGCK